MGAPGNLISESFDGQMSYSVTSYLRKLKKQVLTDSVMVCVCLTTPPLFQTKTESERVVATVSKKRAATAVDKKPSAM